MVGRKKLRQKLVRDAIGKGTFTPPHPSPPDQPAFHRNTVYLRRNQPRTENHLGNGVSAWKKAGPTNTLRSPAEKTARLASLLASLLSGRAGSSEHTSIFSAPRFRLLSLSVLSAAQLRARHGYSRNERLPKSPSHQAGPQQALQHPTHVMPNIPRKDLRCTSRKKNPSQRGSRLDFCWLSVRS